MSTLTGRPIIKSAAVFDKYKLTDLEPYIINFIWNGPKSNGSRLKIIETGQTHDMLNFSSTYHSITLSTCNALELVNGKSYHATITMLDSSKNELSNPSEQFLIHCYSTPTFEISNLANNHNLGSSDFSAIINYHSIDNMELSSYKFNLYDNTGKFLIDSSPELYGLAATSTEDYSYTFKGLEDGNSYYIEAIGLTVYGMELYCSYHVTVNYSNSSTYSLISTSATRDGNISLDISCIPMKYFSSDTLSFTPDNEIDLRDKNSFVKYGISKHLNNFKLKAKLRGIKSFSEPIIQLSDSNYLAIDTKDIENDDTVISIMPEIHYIYDTVLESSNTSSLNLIRPKAFTYSADVTNPGATFVSYIQYIKSAYMTLNLVNNDESYYLSSTQIELSYNQSTDEFFLDEEKNIIIEITKNDGNYDLAVTQL